MANTSHFRAATFDVESSALEAIGAGWLLLATIKPIDDKPVTFRYDKMGCPLAHEKWLVKAVLHELAQYDLLIGHNAERFDWLYLKSRAMVLDLPMPAIPPLVYDTMKAFKRLGFKTTDNGFGKPTAALDKVCDFFGFKPLKTRLYPGEHWKTIWEKGEKRREAMDGLEEHCVGDVLDTERVFGKLWSVDKTPILKRLP